MCFQARVMQRKLSMQKEPSGTLQWCGWDPTLGDALGFCLFPAEIPDTSQNPQKQTNSLLCRAKVLSCYCKAPVSTSGTGSFSGRTETLNKKTNCSEWSVCVWCSAFLCICRPSVVPFHVFARSQTEKFCLFVSVREGLRTIHSTELQTE